MLFPPIPPGKRRIYNVAKYPCPNGCPGSMYFCGPDDSAVCDRRVEPGTQMKCPHCQQYSPRVEPVCYDYLDVESERTKEVQGE